MKNNKTEFKSRKSPGEVVLNFVGSPKGERAKMKRLVLISYLLVIILFISGCATPPIKYNIITTKDEFDNCEWKKMAGNILGDKDTHFSNDEYNTLCYVELNIQRYMKGNAIKYSLHIKYICSESGKSSWLFITSGESLILLVDAKRIGFTGEGSSGMREVQTAGSIVYVIEQAFYRITPEQIKEISYASEIKVKIIGKPYYIERFFTAENLQNFKQFYEEFVKSPSNVKN